jgi:predicted extracellular nuclease
MRPRRGWWLLTSLLVACAAPAPRPAPVPAAPPEVVLGAPPADWATLAGQAVRIDAPLTVVDSFGLVTHGELQVAFGGRLPIPTEVAEPGADAAVVATDNRHRRLVLDDGRGDAPSDAAWPLPGVPDAQHLRYGSTLTGLHGRVIVGEHGVRVIPTNTVDRIDPAPRPAAPTVPGALRLGSFNVLNLFNGDGHGGGFPTPRGAKTAAEFARQQAKLVASVQALAPDAAALMEVENDGYGADSTLAQFVAALDVAGPVSDYAFVDAGTGPGTDQIRVAIIYRTGKLRPRGKPARLEGGPFADRSRVPLAQAFNVIGAKREPPLVLVAVHLKSKGCGHDATAASGSDADQHDGQSCFNATRVDSARRIDAWLRTDPTRSHSDRTVLLGDFNSYSREQPLRVLRDAGWIDAFDRYPEPGPTYSFVFGGEAGRLDHALLSPAAAEQLRGAAHWHNNADEPAASAYEAGTDLSAYGASDHDPLVIGGDWRF